MVPWRGLPEEERWGLVERVKSFSARFREEETSTAVVIPPAPADADALVVQGGQLYARLRCGACHGTGDERAAGAALLEHDPGRKVRIRDLSSGAFLRGTSMRDIYLTLRTGLDGTPMGSYADGLSPGQTWAIAAYVRTLITPDARAP
jgi:cytochrome c oxidase cbb3-type subunit 2